MLGSQAPIKLDRLSERVSEAIATGQPHCLQVGIHLEFGRYYGSVRTGWSLLVLYTEWQFKRQNLQVSYFQGTTKYISVIAAQCKQMCVSRAKNTSRVMNKADHSKEMKTEQSILPGGLKS